MQNSSFNTLIIPEVTLHTTTEQAQRIDNL